MEILSPYEYFFEIMKISLEIKNIVGIEEYKEMLEETLEENLEIYKNETATEEDVKNFKNFLLNLKEDTLEEDCKNNFELYKKLDELKEVTEIDMQLLKMFKELLKEIS